MKKQYNITHHANGFLVERGETFFTGGFSIGGGSGGSVRPDRPAGEAFFFPTAEAMGAWIATDLAGPKPSGVYITMTGGGGGGGGGGGQPAEATKRKPKRKARK